MKKLRKTLAMLLALVLLVSVIPFAVAEGADAVFAIATVNGTDYDGTTPIVCGDTISVDLTLKPAAEDNLVAWMFGYNYDSNALTYGGTAFDTEKWTGTTSDHGDYILIGGTIKVGQSVSGTEIHVATINFTVNETFTGDTEFEVNVGPKNYFSIKRDKVVTEKKVAEGFSFTVYVQTDKTALKEQLDIAAALDEDDYTPNSWSALTPVLTDAQAVYDNPVATQTQIDEATTALANAIGALVERANKLALTNAINTGLIEAAKDYYTPESVANLNSAIATAQGVLNDDNATQNEVDVQTGLVQQAINDLVYNKLVVRFLNWDGSVYDSQEVQYGGGATAPATNPTKPADETYTYEFNGWIGDYSYVTAPVDILPDFTGTKIDYTVDFVDYDNSLIERQTYNYGDTITAPADPTREADETYTYEFAGWSPAVETCTGNQTFTATYTPTYIEYPINFEDYDGTPIETVNYHWGDTVNAPADPTREADETYTYEFAGWSPEVAPVAGEATYKATYTPIYREYEIKFVNYNGDEIETYHLHWGDEVTAPEDPAPVKPEDDTYTYHFIGWSPAVVPVAGDAVYVAQFEDIYKEYEIKFVDYDESEIDTYTLHWGDTVTPPADPTREADDTYTYEFAGWSPEVDVVSGSITYTATYTETYKEYTIKFVNYDESEVATYTLHWGDEVQLPENPTKPADEQYSYRFTGWAPEVTAVAGDATYTAQFEPITNSYIVYFLNYNGDILKQVEYEFGETPVAPEDITPTRPDDDTNWYEFIGWTPDFAPVEGDTNYTAVFEPHELGADYEAVYAAVEQAMQYSGSTDYTEVSYNRLFASVNAVDYDLKISDQTIVDAYATTILENIAKLVSTTAYDASYAKCAAVNNDNNQYTVESFAAFQAAFAPLSEKQDFNTEEATQADVDSATAALEDAYALLEASTLQIDGATEYIGESELRIQSNTSSETTTLQANDGGAGTATLAYTDAQGNEVTNPNKSLGTGYKVELVQGGEVKLEKYIIVFGDINGDGQVSIVDIRLAKKMATSTDGFTEYQIQAAKCGGADVDVEAVIALAKAV